MSVQFDGKPPRPVSIRPHLLRVVPPVIDRQGLNVEDIVAQLYELLDDLHLERP